MRQYYYGYGDKPGPNSQLWEDDMKSVRTVTMSGTGDTANDTTKIEQPIGEMLWPDDETKNYEKYVSYSEPMDKSWEERIRTLEIKVSEIHKLLVDLKSKCDKNTNACG